MVHINNSILTNKTLDMTKRVCADMKSNRRVFMLKGIPRPARRHGRQKGPNSSKLSVEIEGPRTIINWTERKWQDIPAYSREFQKESYTSHPVTRARE